MEATVGSRPATTRPLTFPTSPISSWTLHFQDHKLETAYQKSQYKAKTAFTDSWPTAKLGRSVFTIGSLCVWVLMVLASVGGYAQGNLSKDTYVAQLAVFGILAVGGASLLSLACCSRSGVFAYYLYPALFLFSALCYSFSDQRFLVRVTSEEYTGSTNSCVVPIAVLSMLLPETISHRFVSYLLAVSGSFLIIMGFQVAGVRVNSGLAEAVLYLLLGFWNAWKVYSTERQQRIKFYNDTLDTQNTNKDELEAETWGLIEETSNSDIESLMKLLRQAFTTVSEVVNSSAVTETREKLKSAMRELQEIGKNLHSCVSHSFRTGGILSKTVDEYRMHFSDPFFPPQLTHQNSQKPQSHQILYAGQDLVPMLNQLEKNWNFDMFFLAQISGLRPLEMTGTFCIKKYALDLNLKLSEDRVVKFFQALERKYKPNPYHNSTHAADVLNSLLFMYKHSEIFQEMTELELLGSIIAALGHDVGHPAFSNRYMINTKSSFALLCKSYIDNDVSVLEMMHAALTYELLSQEQVLEHLEMEQWMLMRKLVTEMILATDMMRHFELVGTFQKKYGTRSLPFTEFEDKLALYRMCIKCADIAHAGKAVDLHEKWTMRVVEEFFHQGDLEREQNIPISNFCDRLKSDLPKNQSGFILGVVKPMFIAMNAVVKSDAFDVTIIEQLDLNVEHWMRKADRKKRSSIADYPARRDEDGVTENVYGGIERSATRVVTEENTS